MSFRLWAPELRIRAVSGQSELGEDKKNKRKWVPDDGRVLGDT